MEKVVIEDRKEEFMSWKVSCIEDVRNRVHCIIQSSPMKKGKDIILGSLESG